MQGPPFSPAILPSIHHLHSIILYLQTIQVCISLGEILPGRNDILRHQEAFHRLPGSALVIAQPTITSIDRDGRLQNAHDPIRVHAWNVAFTDLHSQREIRNDRPFFSTEASIGERVGVVMTHKREYAR